MKRRDRGFTLLEMVFAITIMAIVVVAVYTVFISQQQAMLVQDEVNEMQGNARAALELMANDLRQTAGVNTAQLHLVSIQANYDADSTLERVKYWVLNSVLKREFVDTSTTTTDIADNVVDLSFVYYDPQDAEFIAPVATGCLTSIRRILVSLTVQSPKAVAKIQGVARKRTFKAAVMARNLWLVSPYGGACTSADFGGGGHGSH